MSLALIRALTLPCNHACLCSSDCGRRLHNTRQLLGPCVKSCKGCMFPAIEICHSALQWAAERSGAAVFCSLNQNASQAHSIEQLCFVFNTAAHCALHQQNKLPVYWLSPAKHGLSKAASKSILVYATVLVLLAGKPFALRRGASAKSNTLDAQVNFD